MKADDTNADLKEIERKAFRSTYQDGLWDICFGIFILAHGLIPYLKETGIPRVYGYLILFIPALILWAGKKYITIPRFGMVKFGPEGKKRKRKSIIVNATLGGILVGILILIISFGVPDSWKWSLDGYGMPIITAIFGIITFAFVAYFMQYDRLYLYGVFIGGGFVLAEFFYRTYGTPTDGLLAFGLTGVGVTIYGIIILINFMRKYPLPSLGDSNGV